jgi:hypothetical protein
MHVGTSAPHVASIAGIRLMRPSNEEKGFLLAALLAIKKTVYPRNSRRLIAVIAVLSLSNAFGFDGESFAALPA